MRALNNLFAWKTLEQFYRSGSLQKAADILNVEVSTVSRQIGTLEKALNKKLIKRGTRPATITPYGEELLKKVQPVLKAQKLFLDNIAEDPASLSGVIKFSAASGSLSTFLIDWLEEFRSLYPGITFDVRNGRQLEECKKGLIDVVSFNDQVGVEDLMVFNRGGIAYVAVASPSYLEKYGEPKHPRDLINHQGFTYSGPVRPLTKQLVKGNESCPLVWKSSMQSTDILMIQHAAVFGLGIVADMPLAHCIEQLERGELKLILPGWHQQSWGAYVACSSNSWYKKRVRLFLDWYIKRSRKNFESVRERGREVVGDLIDEYYSKNSETEGNSIEINSL